MKLAIQGHPTRGKEIIQILKSLGATSYGTYDKCSHPGLYWYINKNREITCDSKIFMCGYKLYTLEEFEKEFPFKVGDIVQTKQCGEPAEVIKLYPNPACIISYKVRYKSGKEMQHCPENIKFYKEMKEERSVKLTLDKAKEWYKKGGELREIALQAYSEEELTKAELPKTWKEFCTNYPIQVGEAFINGQTSLINKYNNTFPRRLVKDKNVCPSEKSAEAHLAMIQLEQLRNCWRRGWVQTPTDAGYRINKTLTGDYVVMSVGTCKYFLSFPTKKMAEEFLECFRDLIEQAEDLI